MEIGNHYWPGVQDLMTQYWPKQLEVNDYSLRISSETPREFSKAVDVYWFASSAVRSAPQCWLKITELHNIGQNLMTQFWPKQLDEFNDYFPGVSSETPREFSKGVDVYLLAFSSSCIEAEMVLATCHAWVCLPSGATCAKLVADLMSLKCRFVCTEITQILRHFNLWKHKQKNFNLITNQIIVLLLEENSLFQKGFHHLHPAFWNVRTRRRTKPLYWLGIIPFFFLFFWNRYYPLALARSL